MYPGDSSGVAAVPPAGDLYFGEALALSTPGEGQPGGYQSNPGTGLHFHPIAQETSPLMFGEASPGGEAAVPPHELRVAGWKEVLDWRHSPAPWVLGLLLVMYGWLHVSANVKARAGRASAGAAAVL
jgi:hypothetical protein